MSELYSDSIFWIEVEKIKPNPYQPRKEFNQEALNSLAESIRQYGVLQPLVVTRQEQPKADGGIAVEYELIAGERRLRAAKIAGVAQVPVVIRTGEDNNLMKLELAIIENLQREDLNPVDRAKAFQRFVDEFHYKHSEIAKKIGMSREYVSNSLRLLTLPEEILTALTEGKITEGHARPLMMLNDRPEEQITLFKEALHKKLTVRDVVGIARRIAKDKVRKKTREFDPEILNMEKKLTEQLGTRVHIEQREVGGKITIDFFSQEDLKDLLVFMQEVQKPNENGDVLHSELTDGENNTLSEEENIEKNSPIDPLTEQAGSPTQAGQMGEEKVADDLGVSNQIVEEPLPEEDTESTGDHSNVTLGENFTGEKDDIPPTDIFTEEDQVNSNLAGQVNQGEQTARQFEQDPLDSGKINDFDANLMGGAENSDKITTQEDADTIPKEDSVRREIVENIPTENENIPVPEKILDVPQAPVGTSYEPHEPSDLNASVEEKNKENFVSSEDNNIPKEGEDRQPVEEKEDPSFAENFGVAKPAFAQGSDEAKQKQSSLPKNDDDELYSIKNFSL